VDLRTALETKAFRVPQMRSGVDQIDVIEDAPDFDCYVCEGDGIEFALSPWVKNSDSETNNF
jgi:hypothetical protein